MNWARFFKATLRIVFLVLLALTAVFGAIGFLVNGVEGLVNGAGWGVVLGAVSVPFISFIILYQYWGDIAGSYGEQWIKRETEGEE